MKIGGVEINGPCEEVLVLPRPTSEDIVFRAVAVADLSEFEELCPKPQVPKRIVKGGTEDNVDNPGYIQAVQQWGERRFDFICLRSLETSDIEWDTVDLSKPSTWSKWQKELQDAGLSTTEVNRVVACVLSANSLDEHKLREARESFLRGQGSKQAKSSGQPTEPESTQSGQPAKD